MCPCMGDTMSNMRGLGVTTGYENFLFATSIFRYENTTAHLIWVSNQLLAELHHVPLVDHMEVLKF